MAGWQDVSQVSDGELLDRFIAEQDALAFEALMQRHGPMVFGVCRRLLHHAQDAEDAFQATFLVLVKKATSVRPRDMVANWLYGVAYRAALKARSLNCKRRNKESQMAPIEHSCEPRELWSDVSSILDEELERLPDKYRAAVVLCELEGKSRKEVADQLRIPEGTLSSRLATARKMLGKKLSKRGITLSAGALATLFPVHLASAAVPAALMSSTLKAAQLAAAGQVLAAGVVSTQVAALTTGVLNTMFVSKVKMALFAVLAVGLLATGGTGYVAYQQNAPSPVLVSKDEPDRKQENPPPARPEPPAAVDKKPEPPLPPRPDEPKKPEPEENFKQRMKKWDDEILGKRALQLRDLEVEEKRVADALKKEQEAMKLGDKQAFARIQKLTIEKIQLSNQRNYLEHGLALGSPTKYIAPPIPTDEQRLGVHLIAPYPVLAKQLGLPKNQGVIVERMEADSAAARAGLQLHDILLKIDGKPIPSERKELKKFLADVKTDTPFEVVILRDGKQLTLPAFVIPSLASRVRPLGELPPLPGWLGTKGR